MLTCLQTLCVLVCTGFSQAISIHQFTTYRALISVDNAMHDHTYGIPDLLQRSSPTDGSGAGFSPVAILWIVFSFAIGLPLTILGFMRSVWANKLANASGIGVILAVFSWTVIINLMSAKGLSDAVVLCIVLASVAVGALLGYFTAYLNIGVFLLSLAGGISAGLRLVLVKKHLLISNFMIDWVIIGLFGLLGTLLFLVRRHMSMTAGCFLSGTFFISLAVDLIANKQDGISQGLRYLFDCNRAHETDIVSDDYYPPLSTTIVIIVSLIISFVILLISFRIWSATSPPEPEGHWDSHTTTPTPKGPADTLNQPHQHGASSSTLLSPMDHRHVGSYPTQMRTSPVMASRFSWDSR